jgi:hypothetical protein
VAIIEHFGAAEVWALKLMPEWIGTDARAVGLPATGPMARSGDPRPSLEERYGSHEAYVAAVRKAADRAMRAGYLLQPDAESLIRQAEASKVLR